MARTKNHTTYRLITPPHMDVTINFQTQDEAITEAKKRGAWHPTHLLVKNLEGEWQLIYNSIEDEQVERKRMANEDFKENRVEPYVSNMLQRILGACPILFIRRRKDGGMSTTEVFISKDEDPLPIVRAILMRDDFICWTLPSFSTPETRAIKRFYPFGSDASYLFREAPVQTYLKFKGTL